MLIKKAKISGWGLHPAIEVNLTCPKTVNEIVHLSTKKCIARGIYNLGSVNPPRVADLIKFIIKEVNSRSFIVPTWGKGSKAILSFLDTINLTLLYPEQFMIADQNYVLDIRELTEDLNIHPKFNDKDMLLEAYRTYCNYK